MMTGGMHTNGKKWLICRSCNTEKCKRLRKNKGYLTSLAVASRRSYEKHKEKWVARAKLRYAVKKGEIKKPVRCEVCEEAKPLQGHHPDYNKPLEVVWLCTGCHADSHNFIPNLLT